MIIGIDEVGRGPLAGPVVACACHLPEALQSAPEYAQLRDSKKLSVKKRESLSAWLCENALYAIGEASVEDIDSINILQATFLAMERAYSTLLSSFPASVAREGNLFAAQDPLPSALQASPGMTTYKVLIDGNRVPKSMPHARSIIGGDGLIPEISAASIIAKVYRDKLMADLAKEWNMYGWDSNAGYGTAVHMEAMKMYGVTEHHRKSFAPVRGILAS